MSEPIDMRKYNFVNMPIKEQWGVFAPNDSPLFEKESVSPEDLKGVDRYCNGRLQPKPNRKMAW